MLILLAHLSLVAMMRAGPRRSGQIQNNGGAYVDGDANDSGVTAGVSDDQYADSALEADGAYQHTSRSGRSGAGLHEQMQSTNSSRPVGREYVDGADQNQSVSSGNTQ